MADVSVIIPARNEKYLQNTINSVLEAIEADTEIIVILDGYWPYEPIPDNPKVNIIHYTESHGQRQGINAAAKIAQGKFIMKLDAHCAVGKGFDRILMQDWQPGWTLVPRMYNLDINTWTPKHLDNFDLAVKRGKVHDYMYVGFNERNELRTLYYEKEYSRENYRLHQRPQMIDETMSCMGLGWFLSVDDFWKQGGCDENHGSWGQQGVEVALKAWLSGGALMVDKNTWFAHWFRASDGGFPYSIKGNDIVRARAYSKDLWLNDKWPQATRKLQWLVDKFNPPGWENYMSIDKVKEINEYLYHHQHKKHHDTFYRGIVAVKMPSDLLLYHRVIWETKPDIIIEIGTRFGGTSLFLQDQLDVVGNGKVFTIDIKDQVVEKDPRITYLLGNSIGDAILDQVKKITEGKRTMIIVDGDHRRIHVKWELHYYSPLVSPGCYLVVEDCFGSNGDLYHPGEARDWFLKTNKNFIQTNLDREFLVGYCRGGWLKRK